MPQKIPIRLEVNGKTVEAEIPAGMLLVEFIRNHLELTGTKIGCGMGECGACTILLDGKPVNSCLMLACQANGRSVTTIEGISPDGRPTPLQQAFMEEGAIQCGFCTPGFIMSATALLRENPLPDEETIREAISGNLCRCTGYNKIVKAVQKASREKPGS